MNVLKGFLKGRNSAGEAKQRLRFVLIHDRAEIPPGVLDLIKDDIIAVISRRLPIDRASVNVNLDIAGDENRIFVDIPLLANANRKSEGARHRI
ncbi:MAG TPA: cell division topological specificity factor MinE [Anaerolineae bacterium]|jgi:cell division topological specificity factor